MIAVGLMAKTAFGFLKSVPWPVYAGLGLLAGGLFYGHLRYNAGQASVQGKFDAFKAQVADDIQAQAAFNKAKQARDKLAFDSIANSLRMENEQIKSNTDATIAELRAGTVKLRDRFKCPSKTAEVAGSGQGDNEASETGLSDEDAGFLIRFAGEADTVANTLTACQNILRAERE